MDSTVDGLKTHLKKLGNNGSYEAKVPKLTLNQLKAIKRRVPLQIIQNNSSK